MSKEMMNIIDEECSSDDSPATVSVLNGEGKVYKMEDLSYPPIHSEFAPSKPILKLYESFGYDCHKKANIQMLDKHTLVYVSGNFVHLFNINTKKKSFIRSLGGQGIGHITLHPSAEFIAVAEKGVNPEIYVYDCSTLKVKKILRGGADYGYAFITFNPTGTLMASVATESDYTLTVWNWIEELIILRSTAYYNDVYVVSFSLFTPGFLTTGGTGHVKFWKMAKTFTGLKLQGVIGRFGRTEVSTIEGVIQFPDGKVLSGSEWGNMLVWDADLIKVELIRRMGKFCHTAPIIQFLFEEGEILSVGYDGWIKVWQFEIIDAADSQNGKGTFELEPLNELRVGTDVRLMHVVKSLNPHTSNIWFAQDYNGGIWKLDFSFSHISKAPEKLLSCHSGAIRGMSASPISHLVATTGEDGFIRLYDVLSKELLCEKRFINSGSTLAWFPQEMNERGDLFSVGFSDGILRVLAIQTVINSLNEPVIKFLLLDCLKPHVNTITGIAFYCSDTKYLITGSEDKTVFLFSWATYLTPIGFVTMPSRVSSVSCSPLQFKPRSVLVTCVTGEIIRFDLLEMNKKTLTTLSRKKTFSLDDDCKLCIAQAFDVKQIIKRIELAREKLKRKQEKSTLEQGVSVNYNYGTHIYWLFFAYKPIMNYFSATDVDLGEEEVEEEEEEEEPVVKFTCARGPLIFGFCSQLEFKFWISMGNDETGYLYEYEIQTEEQESNFPISNEPTGSFRFEDITRSSVYSAVFSPDGHYFLLGTKDGMIFIFKLIIPWLLDEFEYFWGDRIHDGDYGTVTNLCFTYDQRFLLSCGNDGSLFCFTFQHANSIVTGSKAVVPENREEDEFIEVNDIAENDFPSLEEERCKMEFGKLMKQVEKKKTIILTHIHHFQNEFLRLLQSNSSLPTQMQMKRQDIIPNLTLRQELIREFADMEKQTRAELAWEAEKYSLSLKKLQDRFKAGVKWDVLKVKAFKSNATVSTYRLAFLSEDIKQVLMDKEEKKPDGKSHFTSQAETKVDIQIKLQDKTTEKQILKHISEVYHLNIHVLRVIKRIEERKLKRAARRTEWEELKCRKPDENKGDPAVQKALEEAKNNQGDYNLKSSPDYVVPDHLRMTTKKKLKELVSSLCMDFDYKEEFNQKVLNLRNNKKDIISRITWISERLNTIQKTMQPSEKMGIPVVPLMESYEIPEDILKKDLAKLVPATDSGSTVGSGSEKPTSKMPGMSRFRVSVVSAMLPTSRARASVMLGKSPLAPAMRQSTAEIEAGDTTDADLHTALSVKCSATPLEERIRKMALKRHLHEQTQLNIEAERLKSDFDENLHRLLQEKYRLDVALKMGSVRQIILYGEMQLLAQFETEEEAMLAGINQTLDEKNDLQTKIQDLQIKSETKKREIERLKDQEKLLLQELYTMIGEHNKFSSFLTKVYKKKIKRSKKKATGAEGEEEEESSESDEDFDLNGEEEDDDDEFIDDRECPEGCDLILFNSVLALRERRLDIEELLSEIRKLIEALRKESEAYNKKLKNIQSFLLVTQTDFKKVQQEKQSRVNELLTLAPIKLNQIQYIVNGVLPSDLSSCLIFPANTLKKLEDRIRELQQERIIQRQNQHKSKLHHSKLVKECQMMDNKIALLQTKCHDLMIEKFGCVVDLDHLESYAVNKAVEEMKEKVKKYQRKFEKERINWKKITEKLEEDITSDILNNTLRLLGINEAMTEIQSMGAKFSARQKTLPLNLMPDKSPRQIEEDRLEKLVHCQEEEIVRLQKKLKHANSKSFCPSRELQHAEAWECKYERDETYLEDVTPEREFLDMKALINELFSIDAKEEEKEYVLIESDEEPIAEVLPPELSIASSHHTVEEKTPSEATNTEYDQLSEVSSPDEEEDDNDDKSDETDDDDDDDDDEN